MYNMAVICSKDNQIYKMCRKLNQKKYRDRAGKYLIEGENLLEEAFKCGCAVDKIIMRESYKNGADIRPFETSEKKHKEFCAVEPEKVFMTGSLFDKVARTEASRGILAIVRKPEVIAETFMNSQGQSATGNRDYGVNIVVLDRLQDPGNLGTIIRTADAAGYGGVVAVKGTGDVYSPKVVRSAAGSLFRIPVLYMDSAEEIATFLKAHGKKIIVTCFDTENLYYDTDMSKNIALVIGNEGNGVSREFLELADKKIKIPMEGTIDSLNASVAAGILMYCSVEQCKKHSRHKERKI